MAKKTAYEAVARLRRDGYYYHDIDDLFGWYRGRAWQIHNRDAKHRIDRESTRRYQGRGRVALCDLPEDRGN